MPPAELLLLLAALALAFSNGANDNFKGFATVWGSATLSYRQALVLATIASVAGSIASLWLADAIAQAFSGKGLVPADVLLLPQFTSSVAGGAALTVLLATRLGLPVSTTHALVGGLVGAGLGGAAGSVELAPLLQTFVLPLLASPLLAAALSWLAARALAAASPVPACACWIPARSQMDGQAGGALVQRFAMPALVVADRAHCEAIDSAVALPVSRWMDRLHVLSAMSICFARSVNDTPKLAALLLAAQAWNAPLSAGAVAAVMALGGLMFGQRVARTMSQRVARLGHRDGLIANLVTALLVLFASKLGAPVSTTHVSVGAIAGAGASGRSLAGRTLRHVLLSWLATLPLAAAAAFALARLSGA